MITKDELIELSHEALELRDGVGHPYLQELQESWAPYMKFLYLCVAQYKPQVVLELGVYNGTCTGHMAYGNKDTLVLGVDKEFQPAAWDMRAQFPNITLIDGDTVAMKKVVQWFIEDKKIGLIFLDSIHDGVTSWNEFNTYKDLFADECIVACDDLLGPAHLHANMQELFWGILPGEKEEMHYLHPVPKSHIGIIDQPGFGVSIVRK